ncbi:PIR Superfamily Protein [Plasmodium ovale wallikeri]|uniref:PIR Superfamily Protein n=2 Tax=Plasmodium ovale TaxID=36330 RepID=A0A1A9A6A0_PLAOA|nr:PIR Superfamily Protein [Plasmodium ovale wallikeri]SBT57992.1 PIR Superfamily Protein [Plasmodium ovale wallikeri]SBT73124.1 PIR protein [Plasmodium ovale]
MPPKKVTGKYKFCINAPYYEMLVQLFIKKKKELDKIENCDNFSQDKTFLKLPSATQICKEFTFLHDSLSKYRGGENRKNESFTEDDCNFLNYWLNDQLRNNNDFSISVKEIYNEIKRKNVDIFSKHSELDEHMVNIETKILENMKFLYELYYNAVKIINMMRGQDYSDEEQENKEQEKENKKEPGTDEHDVQPQGKEEHEVEEKNSKKKKSCSDYIMECDKNYKEAMNRCLNTNDDFYNALKIFTDSYGFLTEPSSNESNDCNPREFSFFPEYDPVPEKEKRIMTIKISSTLSVLSLALPLIYKFTPFGPFLRAKINMVKDRWMNPDTNGDELLPLSTDIEDIISENENYNIGYYSETNY